MNKKSIKIWIILLIAPLVLIALSSISQIAVRALISGESNGLTAALNIFSLLVGIIVVFLILTAPLWVTFLVLAVNHNKKIDAALGAQTPIQQPLTANNTTQKPATTDNQ
jgi:uncharacterized BrkB/YihY/UPF0761 family membrane protein